MYNNRLTDIIFADISRYIGYGWKWTLITKVINRYYAMHYTAAKLEAAYRIHNAKQDGGNNETSN